METELPPRIVTSSPLSERKTPEDEFPFVMVTESGISPPSAGTDSETPAPVKSDAKTGDAASAAITAAAAAERVKSGLFITGNFMGYFSSRPRNAGTGRKHPEKKAGQLSLVSRSGGRISINQ